MSKLQWLLMTEHPKYGDTLGLYYRKKSFFPRMWFFHKFAIDEADALAKIASYEESRSIVQKVIKEWL